MARSHCKNTSNMKDQANISSPKPAVPVDKFANANYLDEAQDTELKQTISNLIKEGKEFKEDSKKEFYEIQERKKKTLRRIKA